MTHGMLWWRHDEAECQRRVRAYLGSGHLRVRPTPPYRCEALLRERDGICQVVRSPNYFGPWYDGTPESIAPPEMPDMPPWPSAAR